MLGVSRQESRGQKLGKAIAAAVQAALGKGRQEPRKQSHPYLTDEELVGVRAAASFVRLLNDRKLLKWSKKNNKIPLDTEIKIQKFVFFATKFFGLNLPYLYRWYSYGPHSIMLTADYYGIDNLGDHDAITEAEWPRMGEFIEFANGRDAKWLEVASSIVFVGSEEGLSGDELRKHIKERMPWINDMEVYAELDRDGMLSDAKK